MAERETLSARCRQLCVTKGYRFRPWEIHPADADDGPSPYPSGTAGGASWPKAQRLRRELIAELEQGR